MNSTMSSANILYAHDSNHFSVHFNERKFASHSENDKENYFNSAGTLVAGKALPITVVWSFHKHRLLNRSGVCSFFKY